MEDISTEKKIRWKLNQLSIKITCTINVHVILIKITHTKSNHTHTQTHTVSTCCGFRKIYDNNKPTHIFTLGILLWMKNKQQTINTALSKLKPTYKQKETKVGHFTVYKCTVAWAVYICTLTQINVWFLCPLLLLLLAFFLLSSSQ